MNGRVRRAIPSAMHFSSIMSIYSARRRATGLAAAVLLLSGCPDKEDLTATDSASGSVTDGGTGTTGATDGATTGSSGETPTTGDGGTMGGTQGGMSTSGEPQTTGVVPDTTTAGTTGGVVDPELEASCAALCDKFFECPGFPPLFPDKPSCVASCVESVEGGDQACIDATVTFQECVGAFSCPELLDAFDNDNLGECQAAADAADAACVSNVCEGFGGVGPNGCSIGQSCPNMPMQEYSCEGDTCTCLLDGLPTGVTCPAQGFCDLDTAGQNQAAFDCCGFEF